MGSRIRRGLVAASAVAVAASAVLAAETVVNRYDSRGRLVRIERGGVSANAVVTNYSFDKADNRTTKTTTGSANPPPP